MTSNSLAVARQSQDTPTSIPQNITRAMLRDPLPAPRQSQGSLWAIPRQTPGNAKAGRLQSKGNPVPILRQSPSNPLVILEQSLCNFQADNSKANPWQSVWATMNRNNVRPHLTNKQLASKANKNMTKQNITTITPWRHRRTK